MYRGSRVWHRWIGVSVAIFLAIIAVTGLLLALKSRLDWMRPPEAKGTEIETLADVVSMQEVIDAALAYGIPELSRVEHIDRVDYRPRSNIFKVLSREGYHELQVDGATGKVVQRGFRTDQLTEDIHDLSFFSDLLHAWLLPIVAIALLALSISGTYMFFVPVLRRWKFRREQKDR